MYKRMKRCLSLCLTLCILMMAMPSIGLSEDGAAETTPAAAATTLAAAETTPAAAETTPAAAETTPAAAETTLAAETTPAAAETTPVATETTPAPAPVIVELTGAPEAMEAMYGLYEDELDLPETLTAVYGDGAQAELPVTWVCISDGLGGTAYDGECENCEQACFTFEARLPEGARCAEDLTLPRVQVRLVLPDFGIALYTAADEPTITNSHGVLSYNYTAPEGVTVKEQQWLKNGSPISGATDATYTLTMDDMTDTTNSFSVRLTLSEGDPATSDGYAMSENGEWEMYGMDLVFTGSYDQKTTGFPLKLENTYLENVGVESGASVSGVNLSCNNLTNYGAVSNCTLQLMGDLANKGTISGSDLTVGESLDNSGAISESSLTVNGGLYNSGVIYKSGIDCENVNNEGNGVIHVRVTIDGVDCSSTPDTSWQFLYGANARTALNAWYANQHPEASTDGLHWVWIDGLPPFQEISSGLTLESNFPNSLYNFACLSCSIEAPDGLLAGSTVYAGFEAPKGYTADYTWYHDGEQFATGTEAVLPQLEPGASSTVELKVNNIKKSDVDPVNVELSASETFSGVAYDVTVDYEGDSLVITPRDGVTIDSAAVESGNLTIAGSSDGSSWTVPLSDCGDDIDVRLYVYSEGKQLAGPTSLNLSRAGASVDPSDFTVTVAESANADGSRDVTVRCANPDRYDAIRVGERIYAAAETVSCKVEPGEDVTVYARTPGSDADEKLPSPWVEVGAVEASKWLYLNVSSQHRFSGGNALFWGEVLKIETNLSAAELKWTIDGVAVDPPALDGGLYTIPANVSSLSITATDGSDSITRELSGIECPVNFWLDYENEALAFFRKDICEKKLQAYVGTKDYTLDDTYNRSYPLSDSGLPKNEAAALDVTLESNGSSVTISVTIPARFAGSASYGSVSYDNPNIFDAEFGRWQKITITTEDSDSVKYAAVKLVNSYGDVSCSRDGSGKWVPSIFGGLAGSQTYSIYARQYSVVNGVWTTFASDWFDTGVRITPGEIELSTYAPLVGDTVTATPKFNVPDQNVEWAWQYYLGANGTPPDITKSNSFTIRPDSGYENRRLKVRLYYSTSNMGYAETEVIPAPELIVRREDGTELEKDASGYYIAYLGDKLTAEVANVSQSYLKDADVWFNWESFATGQNINDSSLTIDQGAFSEDGHWYLSVSLQNEALGDLRLECFVRTHYAPAPEVKIDYENETLVAVKPDNEALADYHLRAQSKDGDASISKGENNVYTIPITDFSSGWPDGRAHELDAFWECVDNPSSDSMTFTIPARPAVQDLAFDRAAFAITVKGVSLADYEMKLVAMDGAVTDESVGSMVEDADNGSVRFEGLESSTIYRLWVQKKARDSAFRSEWTSFDVETLAAAVLVPGLDWTATYDPTGFSLSAEDVLNHVTFAEKSTGLSAMIERESVTLTRADGKPFPITDAGTYSLKLTLKGDPADYCELSPDTVTLTVQPCEVSSFDYDSRKTYRGAAYDPYDFEVRVGERVLTKDDYTITVDGGATLRDAGTYTAHIAFKGNFASSLDGEVHPVIEPYTLRATASPLSREYDGTVSVECSADWDNCEPFAGDDVAVKASGTMADASAGSGKTVAIALALEGAQSGNYVLEGASLTGSVDIAKAKAPAFRLPAASRIVYGQALSESALTGGDDVGSFAWEDGSIVPPAGLNTYHVVLTPDDTDNYAWSQEMLVQAIEIIVEQRIANLTVENASKTYGDADPALKLSVTNVLDGDSLDYSISRREGEDVGQYAYSVAEGNNRNYKLNLLPATLTIEPRSIADGSVSISAVSMQTYTGREIRPQPTLRFGDAVLVPGTDYVLSYSNNVKPGRATITITGKGNFSGSRSVNFTIKETAPAATATPAPSFAPISDEALQAYLNGMASLVFDAAYNPVDYEQIPVRVSGEAEENILLICAAQEDDEPAQRSLILNAAQLVKLQQVLQENEIGDLIFENGSAAARMNLAELTGGNMAKLMALILSGGEITEEILQGDWSAMEEAALTEAEYERFSLEVRIAPVVQEDGEQGFEISVWLRCDALNLNVSDLIDSLCVMLDASRLVTAENAGTFDDLYAIARKNGEESELLDSALVLAPTVSEDGDAAESAAPMVTGRYALTALYAGEGMYRIVSVDV